MSLSGCWLSLKWSVRPKPAVSATSGKAERASFSVQSTIGRDSSAGESVKLVSQRKFESMDDILRNSGSKRRLLSGGWGMGNGALEIFKRSEASLYCLSHLEHNYQPIPLQVLHLFDFLLTLFFPLQLSFYFFKPSFRRRSLPSCRSLIKRLSPRH